MPGLLDRIKRGAGLLFSGPDDPGLSEYDNAMARRFGLMRTGLGMLGAETGTPTGQALAQGAMFGQESGMGMRQGQLASQEAMQQKQQQQQIDTARMRMAGGMQTPDDLMELWKFSVATGDLKLANEVLEMYKEQSKPGPGPISVAQNTTLVDPTTREELYRNVGPEKALDLPAEVEAYLYGQGVDPKNASPEQRQAALAWYEKLTGSRGTQINVGTGGQERKGLTDINIGQYETIMADATAAEARMADLDLMESLLDQGMQTGKVADISLPLRQFAASLGLTPREGVSKQELFKSVTNKLALELKRAGGTNQMAGAMSDKDIDFLVAQAPSLANTIEGNRQLIAVMRELANRSLLLSDEADRYYNNRGSMVGWREHRRRWMESHRLNLDDIFNPY